MQRPNFKEILNLGQYWDGCSPIWTEKEDKTKQLVEFSNSLHKKLKFTVLFTTQYNPLGLNINSISWKHLPIVKDNPSMNEIFPNGCVHMVHNDHYNTKWLHKIAQDLQVELVARKKVWILLTICELLHVLQQKSF